MIAETAHLRLRPVTETDVDELFRIYGAMCERFMMSITRRRACCTP